jgi:intracellular multiplication protein IcmV
VIKKTVRGIGRVLKPLVNIPAWMGWKGLKENNQRIGRLAKSILAPSKVEVRRESFESAVERLGLDESTLQARQRYFQRLTKVYLVITVALFAYAIYMLVVGTFLGFLMALVAVWIALVLTFRQHFWYTQIKVRRLGLSFAEWASITFHTSKER